VIRPHVPEEWIPQQPGSKKGEEFCDQLSDYQLLQKGFIPWFELDVAVIIQGDSKCSLRALRFME
jgi:hypothetical protein